MQNLHEKKFEHTLRAVLVDYPAAFRDPEIYHQAKINKKFSTVTDMYTVIRIISFPWFHLTLLYLDPHNTRLSDLFRFYMQYRSHLLTNVSNIYFSLL